MANIVDLFLSAANEAGDKPLFLRGKGAGLSYTELDGATGRLASRLMATGAGAGDRVAVQAAGPIEAMLLYLAVLKAGLIHVCLSAGRAPEDDAWIIADAEPRLIVCDRDRLGDFQRLAAGRNIGILSVEDALLGPTSQAGFRTAPVAGGALACIVYPTDPAAPQCGAMLTHDNLAANARALHSLWRWRSDDVLVHALPVGQTHGLFDDLHCALLAGASILVLDDLDPLTVIDHLPRATVFVGIAEIYRGMLEQPALDRLACATIRLFISDSAPLPAEVHMRFATRTGHRILEWRSRCETGVIASNPYCGSRLVGTIGFPVPGVSVRIADPQGRPLPPGSRGGLEVKSPNVFAGYWRDPDRTAGAFRADGYFVTGELAKTDSDGRVTLVNRPSMPVYRVA